MSAVAERTRPDPGATPAPAPPRRRRWTRLILPTYTGLVMAYLIFPIALMMLYSFNRSETARVAFRWQGFTLQWYRELFQISDLTAALKNSLTLAASSTLIATVMGTLIALAMVRYRFRGRGVTDLVLFMNISAPEIVTGSALLALFVTMGVTRGFATLLTAHVMFSIAFVAITVRARLAGFDRALEEAAQDLGATPWTTFYTVTLPLIFPGVLAGALLAFALSLDDFVISTFVSGQTVTFPLWVFGSVRVGIPPQVFVMGTLIFMFGAALAAANLFLQRRKA